MKFAFWRRGAEQLEEEIRSHLEMAAREPDRACLLAPPGAP